MDYAQQQRSPARHIIGLGIVVALHVVLIWALVNGLGKNIVEIMKAPIETKIIKDTKPPPPPPPPPPPVLTNPPPPYIPPPEIQIQPPPQPHAIRQVTRTPQPPSPIPYKAAPPTPGPAVPDSQVSARPIAGPALEYPPAMQDAQREGRVIVACDVGVDGLTHNCAIQTVLGGAAFGRAALQWVRAARYRPAVHNGVPVPEAHHAFNITFKLNNDDQ